MHRVVLIALLAGACGGVAASGDAGPGDADAGTGADAAPQACQSQPHLANPQVRSSGGRTLGASGRLRLISIVAPGFSLQQTADLHAFGDWLAASHDHWLDIVARDYAYDTSNTPLSLHVDGPALPAPMCNGGTMICKNQLPGYIDDTIAANPTLGIEHQDNNLYILYVPMDTPVEALMAGTATSFHGGFGPASTTLEGYALVQQAGAANFDLDFYTGASSHEVIEAVTNSDRDMGWVLRRDPSVAITDQSAWVGMHANLHVEVADLCEGNITRVDGHVVQRSYSNTAAAAGPDPCVPNVGDAYYSTTMPAPPAGPFNGWTVVSVGASCTVSPMQIAITVNGWSGPDAQGACSPEPWNLLAKPVTTGDMGSLDLTGTPPTLDASTMTNGGSTTLHVTIPTGSCFGSWGSVIVESRPNPLVPDHDRFHRQVYGIYLN